MNCKTLIIAGMHRSTTSLAAQWFEKCGLNIGDKLLEGDMGNIDGHFEDKDFFYQHMEILKDNYLPGGGVVFPYQNKFDYKGFSNIKLSNYHKQKLISTIAFKCKLHPQFGWKDPRTCLFLDFYDSVLPNAKYFFVFRDYFSVVNSLINRSLSNYRATIHSMRLGKFRHLFKKKKFYRTQIEKANAYLEAWIFYNKKIIDHIQQLDPNSYILTSDTLIQIPENSNFILSKISEWGFIEKKIMYSELFKESKKTKLSSAMNFDKAILEKAKIIYDELMEKINIPLKEVKK